MHDEQLEIEGRLHETRPVLTEGAAGPLIVADDFGGTGWPLIRTQVDGRQDEYSLRTGLDCSGSKDMTRQEFADDADIMKLMHRYGVMGIPQRQATFGEVDYDMDLQGAYDAMGQAQQAWRALPEELRLKYPTWQSMLNGVQRGEIVREPEVSPKVDEPAQE